VCLGRDHCQHLDGKYTAFGTVVEGIEAVRAIAATEIGPGDAPLSPQTMTSVSEIE
jgi:cyclophilin family peptidyl-prolyl cis-trans isomerase